MPPYLTFGPGWEAIWPIPVAAVLLAFLVSVIACPKEGRKDAFLALAAFSMLGLVTGYMTGLSREPAVPGVLPAVLSFLAGLFVYMLGKRATVRRLVCLAVLIFSLSLLIGSSWGSTTRVVYELNK